MKLKTNAQLFYMKCIYGKGMILVSFSSEIKQELNKNNKLANKEIVKYELIGYLISGNIDILNKNNIKFSTESDYNINRFSKLLSNLNINYSIDINRKKLFNKT